jgi:hypothetical protein
MLFENFVGCHMLTSCLLCSLPADQRKIPLEYIAERTKLTLDGVEFLLMKTLSLHLIEGVIDQVDNIVQVLPALFCLPCRKSVGLITKKNESVLLIGCLCNKLWIVTLEEYHRKDTAMLVHVRRGCVGVLQLVWKVFDEGGDLTETALLYCYRSKPQQNLSRH